MRVFLQAAKFGVLALVTGFIAPASPLTAQDDETCLMCHSDAELFSEEDTASPKAIRSEMHAQSLHGSIGLSCVDCHTDLAGVEDLPHPDELQPAVCNTCHTDVQETFEESVHGYALARGNPRAPRCRSCHGAHPILPASDPAAPTHRARLAETCAGCHGSGGLLTEQMVKRAQPYSSYSRSVHGRGVANGQKAPTCADCHGVHDLRGHQDPRSKINHANVAATCGRCHESTRDEYDRSIHGLALQAGVSDAPTCNDCHGEHLVLSPKDPDSRTFARRQASETCGSCHADPEIIAKYDLDGIAVGSYIDSYHGWASLGNSDRAASCVSCHTAHGVLPKEHPQSTVSTGNVVGTCRKCHERADAKFAASYTHEAASITANPINRWIRKVYWVMIFVVIGGMILHNVVILNYHLIEKRRRLDGEASVRRLDRSQIVQHILLAGSFILLVITGFALRYPDSWWVRLLGDAGMTEPVRSYLHRVFAVALVAVSLVHVHYMLLTRRGRHELGRIAPARADLRQFADNMLFHVWRRRRPARFGRYDYTQKAEYWALIWGTLLMALTGFVLWFPQLAVAILPSWIVPAAQTVHFYEAWLATLAIVFWHFFFVIFHPEEYPMSWTWLNGRMSVKAARQHHAAWYEEEISARPPGKELARPAARKGGRPGAKTTDHA